jgi:myosin-7
MYFWLKKLTLWMEMSIKKSILTSKNKLNLFCFPFQGGSVVCDGRDDAAEFADIRSAMKVLMMTDNDIWDILKILAALLHMGNIKYKGKVIANLDATEIPDHSNVERVATILGLDKLALIDALTTRTIFAQGETVVS